MDFLFYICIVQKQHMYLVFDTTPLSMPKNWKALAEETYAWPRMIHLAWEHFDADSNIIKSQNILIKPDGYEIPYEGTAKHGVDHDEAVAKGLSVLEVLEKFSEAVKASEYVIAHNLTFNERIIGAEYIRQNLPNPLISSDNYCLMREATYYCKIPSKTGGYKWPSLSELFKKCFGTGYEGANHADQDVRAAAMCFFKLLEIDMIELF